MRALIRMAAIAVAGAARYFAGLLMLFALPARHRRLVARRERAA